MASLTLFRRVTAGSGDPALRILPKRSIKFVGRHDPMPPRADVGIRPYIAQKREPKGSLFLLQNEELYILMRHNILHVTA